MFRGGSNIKKLPLFLNETEVSRMLEKALNVNTRDWKIMMLLYYFGLRNNEMTALLTENIDLEQFTLKVVGGKGDKDRIIPIVELNPLHDKKTIKDHLAEWVTASGNGHIIRGDSSDGSISEWTIRRVVKKYAIRAKVRRAEEVHPHTLRHSYATHLVNMGVKETTIQRLLGHSNVNTTQIYAHMGVEQLRKEVRKQVQVLTMKDEFPRELERIEQLPDDVRKVIEYAKLNSKALRVLLGT